MQDLKITIIQSELHWENIASNIEMFDEKINSIREETHLVILPEMFTTGFSMNAGPLAQEMDGSAVEWLKEKAIEKNTDITASVMIREKDRFFNRLFWARPTGELITYDKKHLFRYAGEEKVYTAGEKNITIDLNGWKIRPFVCYDLRFPLWTRNFNNEYDAAIFVANWPEKRSSHWKALLISRAIENQAYVIGVNRVGKDGNGFNYSGDSSIIDPQGEILFRKSHDACIRTVALSRDKLDSYRNIFPAWMDADVDMVRNSE